MDGCTQNCLFVESLESGELTKCRRSANHKREESSRDTAHRNLLEYSAHVDGLYRTQPITFLRSTFGCLIVNARLRARRCGRKEHIFN